MLSKKDSKISRRILGKFARYLKKHGRIQISNVVDVIWTKDVIESSTLPYPIRRAEYPWAVENANLTENMKILDVGSGVSLFPVYLASKGHDVISIDPDKILMERIAPKLAKYSGINLSYRVGDILNLEFEDNYFDRVFCISVIEHLEEEIHNGKYINNHKKNFDVKAIAELLRVLKPGGLLILTFDWNEDLDEYRSYKLQDIIERVIKPYKNNLLSREIPTVNWEKEEKVHEKMWKSFPPHNYVTKGWAIGVILKK
ncbi:class I SAM-dependent methyltransferase [Nitrosopumilus sp. S4]